MEPSHSRQSPMNNNTSSPGLPPASHNIYKPSTSKLNKSFLGEPKFSDVTIRIGDRSLYAHRIVLCQGSEYFSNMLMGRFQESSSKEIELHDDDPDAIFALLRFLYNIPYDAEANSKWLTSLQPHAEVYVVADKYQIDALKVAVANNMHKVITAKSYTDKMGFLRYCESFKNSDDFYSALHIILEVTTTSDTLARKVLMDFLVQNADFFRKQKELLSMFRDHPELAVELISHPDLEIEAEGFWMCFSDDCSTNVPSCAKCNVPFQLYFLRRYRYDEEWECPGCKSVGQPSCLDCKAMITWVAEPECDVMEEESGTEEEDAMELDAGLDAAAKASRGHGRR